MRAKILYDELSLENELEEKNSFSSKTPPPLELGPGGLKETHFLKKDYHLQDETKLIIID